eukprot:905786-Amphidinium_carterae.1
MGHIYANNAKKRIMKHKPGLTRAREHDCEPPGYHPPPRKNRAHEIVFGKYVFAVRASLARSWLFMFSPPSLAIGRSAVTTSFWFRSFIPCASSRPGSSTSAKIATVQKRVASSMRKA